MLKHAVLPLLVSAGLMAAAPVALAATNLVFCSEGSPAGFDPGQYTTGTDFDASAETMFNRLTQFERGGTAVIPGLATSWDVSPDGLTYTFHLRDGVKFHTTAYFKPTRTFNADDVLFTFNRMINKDDPFRKAYPTEFPYFTDMGMDTNIKNIEKVDEHTVKFTLGTVDAAFIQNLAMSFASIQSAEYAAQLLKEGKASDINQKPVGTGPFVFKSYQKDSNIRYTGNKDYWKPEDVKIDNLIFAITTDPSVRIQKLKKNECQITLFPRPADLKALEADKDLKLPNQAGFNLGYIAYNVMDKVKGSDQPNPLADLRVRQALDMSVNKQQIIDSVYQGAGQLAVNAMPPTQWSYDTTIKDAKYDPEKAKALLKEAGVKEGTEIVLWAMPVQRPYNPNAKLMAEMLQNDWKKIGLNVKITSYEWGEYIKRSKGGENQAMIIGWSGDNGDPDNWLNVLFGCDSLSGNNFSKWCDKKFDGIVKEAKATSDVAKRTELYKQAQHILKDAVPMTPIAHSTVYQPMRNTVQDFKISPFGLNSFYGVSVSGK
ncbi:MULTISPECIES: ABC transporter substrate-binding protein [Pseudomonas fluorescens group]|uniref:Solute-binding protein family 5 domain-containing protein n=3 Tax=Pseudomonas fluorescens group TaxID=136843 RepID=A0A3M4ARB8_PSEMA|nr:MULTISPECIES: ABC transporter substrate-binding protein [Pseudomonas fluorescens group]MCD7037455.1 ABC transporter substrate-binding protein [Pseudomonas petroselini]MCD7046478.1 ABC transporter substrate-binding protein [Pseudomonas petroselini]MCF5663767.1 ABC transporter substrate-binding protein [Pseudomonas marginalis]MCM2377145.1 ABC transporter substrate-binding protein [Pseudomonas marginalis]OAJ46590.1 peptide ABC transporter substrate-binding protein [Pseudomonas marginalis]